MLLKFGDKSYVPNERVSWSKTSRKKGKCMAVGLLNRHSYLMKMKIFISDFTVFYHGMIFTYSTFVFVKKSLLLCAATHISRTVCPFDLKISGIVYYPLFYTMNYSDFIRSKTWLSQHPNQLVWVQKKSQSTKKKAKIQKISPNL